MSTAGSEARQEETRALDKAGAFVPHRTGYAPDRLAFLRDWLTRHPHATLHSGEGQVLLRALEDAERERDVLAEALKLALAEIGLAP